MQQSAFARATASLGLAMEVIFPKEQSKASNGY